MASHQQHSLDWYRARLGRITGSCVGKIYGRGRGAEFSKTGLSYLHGVAAERMIPPEVVTSDEYFTQYVYETTAQSKAMRIGSERETEARTLYEIIFQSQVSEVGAMDCPGIPGFASSPDGIIYNPDDPREILGVVEFKCPSPAVYMEYLTQVQTPSDLRSYNSDYFWQCVSHMMVSGAPWCDFTLYCPFNSRPLHRIRIHAEQDYFNALQPRIITALKYIDSLLPKNLRTAQMIALSESQKRLTNSQ